jgi:hypothetical protein
LIIYDIFIQLATVDSASYSKDYYVYVCPLSDKSIGLRQQENSSVLCSVLWARAPQSSTTTRLLPTGFGRAHRCQEVAPNEP